MARNPISNEERACGKFLTSLLNCKIKRRNLSELLNDCLIFIEAHLGYNRAGWNEIKITSTFQELYRNAEPSYIKHFITPYFQYRALGRGRISIQKS